MVVGEPNINNIMGGIENTGSVRLHNHRKKLKQRFDIIKKLGQGTYGKVQLGINKETGQEVAIKTIKKSKIETEADLVRIRREIQIMSSVQHPNIIHIYEVFENREKMVLVMEYAAGGELYDYLSERKVLAEEEARRIFRQIATACYYCHKHKICHRDLKLENILLDEQGNAKIADFGLSNVFDDQRLLSTFCGSPLYASPEIVKGTPYQGPEVDCWSLGVLLYTLVYGAMPFDGSNFKRLVRQISQGDYFEPKKPSRASPLIRDMLTVNPRNRANIEKICEHWWVNEGYDESCLDISEELANQTPVRLDLLLSLAPPAPQLESEKFVVTGENADESINSETALPARSQSVGSLMDFTNPAERRIKDLLSEDVKVSPKRKLESTVSTDQVNFSKDGVKRKDKIIKENTVADITLHAPIQENASLEDASMSEGTALNKSATQTLSREMDVEQTDDYVDPSAQGAACTEIIEDAKRNETKKPSSKIKKTPSSNVSNKILEEINENPSLENISNNVDKENIKETNNSKEKKAEEKAEEKKQEQSKIPAKRKSIKKKVLTDKNENSGSKAAEQQAAPSADKKQTDANEQQKIETEETAQPPNKPVERRRSRIFETAEKFQSMISANDNKQPTQGDKTKKIVIPGVSVGGYKKEFERKASLTAPPKGLSKKPSVDQEEVGQEASSAKTDLIQAAKEEVKPKTPAPEENQMSVENQVPERRSQVQNAVNIISSAIDKDGTRKSKSRPCMTRKPPVPFGTSGRSASGSIPTTPLPQSPPATRASTDSKPSSAAVHGSTPAQVVEQAKEVLPEENKTSSAEITLKSATLPRRKTTKAEIKLDYPAPKPATMGFKTEMAHHVEGLPKLPTQRSEVTFPVSSPTATTFRSASVEPDNKAKQSPRERIIPISFERDSTEEKKEPLSSPPIKPPAKTFQNQRSTVSQRSNSLSRQSTQESDSETTTSTGEPIRKSPREYIIPIAVEGGGYVTPRAGSLEPSDTASTTSTMTSKSKFGRGRRLNDREGSEDESPFAALHRHSSFGRDSDTEDPRRDMFRMHSLRSSRPRKAVIEHNDSFSSGEDDDDDGFEILTAENLFSTLLSRVRDLTQRLNVDGRPGFPTSRLLSSHFDHGTNFWNLHNRMDPLTRYAPIGRSTSREQSVESSPSSRSVGAPWRRSVSRDLASDIESVRNSSVPTPTHTATLPRGDPNSNRENLNLTDLDLKKLKLSDEDALALSYLTPGLSRRIQKQLLAQLAPTEARKLSRTLSMRNSPKHKSKSPEDKYDSTLPRRFSVESSPARYQNSSNIDKVEEPTTSTIPSKLNKSFLPVKSSSTNQTGLDYQKQGATVQPRRLRSSSSVEPKSGYLLPKADSCLLLSPDTSTSDLSNKNDDYSSYKNTSSISSASNLSDSSRLSKYLTPAAAKYAQDVERSGRRSPSARRTSRFLRPDFYDSPKDGNYYLKEKKEREMETQKVLKEIRDKRKGRFREWSVSRENGQTDFDKSASNSNIGGGTSEVDALMCNRSICGTESTDNLLKNVSDNIKNLESNVNRDYVETKPTPTESKGIPDYVNVPMNQKVPDHVSTEMAIVPIVKKVRPSKIVRPKSYPTETQAHKDLASKLAEFDAEKSNTSKLKKPEKIEAESEKQSNKNKFLQTIEKKFEKLRSFSNSPSSISSEEMKAREEKKSLVEDTIKRLREQSLPRNADTCITESGLIKRAVSVEDLSSSDPKQLQASRKSVTKILNLFKKYEDKGSGKKNDKTKTKKARSKTSQLDTEKTDKNESKSLGAVVIISSNNCEKLNSQDCSSDTQTVREKKAERPRSLLLDRVKQFQPAYNGARSDSHITDSSNKKSSKLPVTSFRRSLNLENAQLEPPKFYKAPKSSTKTQDHDVAAEMEPATTPDRTKLKLDLHSPEPSTSTSVNHNSQLLSPGEDDNDSWSICSDYNTQELTSPVSPCNHFYSADENESVSDRIRRKSFYTRFNEKKRPRKTTLGSYKDLDLYKDMNSRKSSFRGASDYGSSDRSAVDLGSSKYRKPCYNAVVPEPLRKGYTRSSSAAIMNDDGYVNVPEQCRDVDQRSSRRRSASCTPGSEEVNNTLDVAPTTGKNRMYSYHNQLSRYNNRPFTPTTEHPIVDAVPSSIKQKTICSSASENHV